MKLDFDNTRIELPSKSYHKMEGKSLSLTSKTNFKIVTIPFGNTHFESFKILTDFQNNEFEVYLCNKYFFFFFF